MSKIRKASKGSRKARSGGKTLAPSKDRRGLEAADIALAFGR